MPAIITLKLEKLLKTGESHWTRAVMFLHCLANRFFLCHMTPVGFRSDPLRRQCVCPVPTRASLRAAGRRQSSRQQSACIISKALLLLLPPKERLSRRFSLLMDKASLFTRPYHRPCEAEGNLKSVSVKTQRELPDHVLQFA